ncbi:DUF1569 domain-containing protein [bacterium]|nr:MAG: DUF1569 domain-containing protein [bacterium]
MKSIFEPDAQKEIMERLNKLTPQTPAQWGKMNAAQMLAHCTLTMQVPVGDLAVKPTFFRYIGRFFKSMATNDKPFSKNSPTAAEFVISDGRDFNKERSNFTVAFNKLIPGEHTIKISNHSFFGLMTPLEWGKLMYKHADHHFKQFGV